MTLVSAPGPGETGSFHAVGTPCNDDITGIWYQRTRRASWYSCGNPSRTDTRNRSYITRTARVPARSRAVDNMRARTLRVYCYRRRRRHDARPTACVSRREVDETVYAMRNGCRSFLRSDAVFAMTSRPESHVAFLAWTVARRITVFHRFTIN